jgi:RNA polymerase sigma-54 factor
MRQELRQLLTPRMIQSMEILQLPLMALEERIEQELVSNPVLEMKDGAPDGNEDATTVTEIASEVNGEARDDLSESEHVLVVKEESNGADDFDRLDKLAEYLENEEFYTNSSLNYRQAASYDGERDKKLDALNNTADRNVNLTDHLLDQWSFIEAPPKVLEAGIVIIKYIDEQGYLRTDLETIRNESKKPLAMEDLQAALKLIQVLEPAGIGARDVRECLLLQIDALEEDPENEDHDFELERKLVSDHLKDLEMNRYPQISKRLGRPMEDIKEAVRRLSRLHPHPGKQIGADDAPPITPDADIVYDEDTDRYEIRMANDPAESLYIGGRWRKMLKDKTLDKKTKEFLSNNVRNARWLLESIEQRKSTIQRVIRAVVDAQREFFDKGAEYLKPLPMISVADQLGIHVATVSRAVSEKWIQTPKGVFPLRRFFSGGTTNAEGEDMSWDAVKEKLKAIIENEDKHNPLNDDEIVEKLKEQGIDLARRTVAKYRKLLNIPTARQRKEF